MTTSRCCRIEFSSTKIPMIQISESAKNCRSDGSMLVADSRGSPRDPSEEATFGWRAPHVGPRHRNQMNCLGARVKDREREVICLAADSFFRAQRVLGA